MANWFYRSSRQHSHDWTIRQLNLQPYQHVLEVGYGSGQLLAVVARTLNIGFLAGIESSIPLYRQAYRRNKAFIRRQLIQLHIGELHELPYPAHYFHTVYRSGIDFPRKDAGTECLRLTSLLRSGGRLVWLSQAKGYRKAEDLRTEAARLQAACLTAGLTDIRTEYQDFPSGPRMAVIGFKPDLWLDPEPYRAINNRLLNPKPHFISNIARMQM
jgi:Protein-L-isoaspartate(D-aspartate) O-methyltransferase (PCMT)